MEYCFGIRLEDVRLHFSPESRVANESFGSIAFGVGSHICFRPGFDESPGPAFTAVLAHEIAHVAQKKSRERIKCGTVSSQRLEQEAGRAVVRVLHGQAVGPLSPDAADRPRCWGPEGHYYTVLWASLAAGLSLVDAKRNAFYCQLPDQVKELDAIAAGLQWAEDKTQEILIQGDYQTIQNNVASGWAKANKAYSPLVNKEYDLVSLFLRREADRQCQWQIQVGLHALTGGNSKVETDYRAKILESVAGASLEYGLGLHAFGDSYAHRNMADNSLMYSPLFGHMLHGHDPDTIDEKRAGNYVSYGYALWGALKKKWNIPNPPLSDDDVADGLNKIVAVKARVEKTTDGTTKVAETQSSVQIKFILHLAALALARGTGKTYEGASNELAKIYRPEDAPSYVNYFALQTSEHKIPWLLPQSWTEFFYDNSGKNGVPLDRSYLERSMKCSREWTATAKPFQFETFVQNSTGTMDQRHKSPSVLGQ
jgi:hypothetical protein